MRERTASEVARLGGKARARKMTKAERSRVARKGGKARARKMTAKERTRSARKAGQARARARWRRVEEPPRAASP